MAAASSLMQEKGPYGAIDRLDHPYGWTVVDTTSMYSNKTTVNSLRGLLCQIAAVAVGSLVACKPVALQQLLRATRVRIRV